MWVRLMLALGAISLAWGQTVDVATLTSRVDNLGQRITVLVSVFRNFDEISNRIVSMTQRVANIQSSENTVSSTRNRMASYVSQLETIVKMYQDAERIRAKADRLAIDIATLQETLVNRRYFRQAVGRLRKQVNQLRDNVAEEKAVRDRLTNLTRHVGDLNDRAGPEKTESHLRSVVWPQGRYSLMMTRTGCPKSELTVWGEGTRTHWTESRSGNNQNANSTADHMPKDLFTVVNGNYLANLRFCTHRQTGPGVVGWPKGTYCINRKNSRCPGGFVSGDITFDDEDRNGSPRINRMTGVDPDGVYNDDTRYRYCCRQDGPVTQKIFLPIHEPFYLYRFQGQCQEVFGMDVTNDWIVLDTADDDPARNKVNGDTTGGTVPDHTLDNIRLELCYYKLK